MKEECIKCGSKNLVKTADAKLVPMSLINPQLIGLMLPTKIKCQECDVEYGWRNRRKSRR